MGHVERPYDEGVVMARQTAEIAHVPNVAERKLIREALIAGGVKERDLDWMVASCPSLRIAVLRYPPIGDADGQS